MTLSAVWKLTYWTQPSGAEVWIEFERGDPGYPVWTGCLRVRGLWWGRMSAEGSGGDFTQRR
jgi:hypothetical protein